MSLSKEEKEKIVELRQAGYSVPEISRLCSVSKATVLRYIKNVAILPQNYERWLARRNASKIISERQWVQARVLATQVLHGKYRDMALLTASLYWAEGAKKDFSFCNTDPKMIGFFVSALRKAFSVSDDRFTISLRLYEDLSKDDSIKHWSGVTGLDLPDTLSIAWLEGRKKGKLPFGMCIVRVKKPGLLFKTISAIIDEHIVEMASPRSSMDRVPQS